MKWVATRSEVFLSDHQARDHLAEAELALDAEGRFLALCVGSDANVGAYLIGGTGGVQTNQYVHLQGTAYAIPAIALHVRMVLTNTTPVGVTRSPGYAETINVLERLIDAAARQCGFDPRLCGGATSCGSRNADGPTPSASRSTAGPSEKPSTAPWRWPTCLASLPAGRPAQGGDGCAA